MNETTIGQPVPRVDGVLKVTGRATYAAEHDLPHLVHAVMVTSTVAKGRVKKLDVTAAEHAAGVLAVITHRNAPRLPYRPQKSVLDPIGERLHVLQDDRVQFNGQPMAVVVADTLDQAEYAASLVRIEYVLETPRLDLTAGLAHAVVAEASVLPHSPVPADTRRGDPERALAEAAVTVEADYLIPRQQHNPMEPHATVARWEGDRLTLWDKTQWVVHVRDELSAVFGLAPEHVHVISPIVGGAFGTTLRAWPHVTLAALAARVVGRLVKLVLTRRQMYAGTGYRPDTWQRVALGASRDGGLTAITHHGIAETSAYEQYVERLLEATGFLHSCPHVATHYRLVPLDVHTPLYMRAPGVASGIFALECAMDELAHALRMDPVALRLLNEPQQDEHTNLPFSSRSTRACYRVASERFGWAARKPEPRSMRADPSRGERYHEILARHGLDALEWTEMTQPGDDRQRYSMHAFGAVFAEVAVDRDFGLVRVRRLVGAYGAGRIMNPRMARSQAISGMVGGIGMALMEHTITDRHSGRIVNADLANYLVPVHADIAELDAIFVEEHDPYVNPLGVKGVGELALVGVAPAIANAVFHATGKRVRDLPITPEKLL